MKVYTIKTPLNDFYYTDTPAKYCDPNSELVKYYTEQARQIRIANELYKKQNDILRERNRTLEYQLFQTPNSDVDVPKLLKENRKLKQSLRKLYVRYIHPIKNDFRICPACQSRYTAVRNGEQLPTHF